MTVYDRKKIETSEAVQSFSNTAVELFLLLIDMLQFYYCSI